MGADDARDHVVDGRSLCQPPAAVADQLLERPELQVCRHRRPRRLASGWRQPLAVRLAPFAKLVKRGGRERRAFQPLAEARYARKDFHVVEKLVGVKGVQFLQADADSRPVRADGKDKIGREAFDHLFDRIDIQRDRAAGGKCVARLDQAAGGASGEIAEDRHAKARPPQILRRRAGG